MKTLRRMKILCGFFAVWFCALVPQLVIFSVFGQGLGRAFHIVGSLHVFLLGLSWLVLFLGPTPLEVLENMRRVSPQQECTIERVYLRFSIDRAARVGIIGVALSALCLLTSLYQSKGRYLIAGVILAYAALAIIRTVGIRRRVLAGLFGTNEYEARVLIKFLSGMYEKKRDPFEPPGGMRRFDEQEEAIIIPAGAEFAG